MQEKDFGVQQNPCVVSDETTPRGQSMQEGKKMKQKDYDEIAKIINNVAIKWDPAWINLVYKLADYFEEEQPRTDDDMLSYEPFNKKQFLKDCGVEK